MKKKNRKNGRSIDKKGSALSRAFGRPGSADAALACIAAVAVTACVSSVRVKETSMQPNIFEDDLLILDKTAYRRRAPKRGDVIVFRARAQNKPKYFIKRVIGLPGDVIDISGGEVLVNGKPQDQSYTNDGTTEGESAFQHEVPEGKLFVLGDNRAVSLDSRNSAIGDVAIKDVVGAAVFRLYPRGVSGRLPRYGADA